MHPDQRIARLASRQEGLVTHGQLTRIGLGRGAIRSRCRTGRLHRLHVGVYAVGHEAIPPQGHLLGAVMTCGSDAALSHSHAVHLWDLAPPWMELDLSLIHVTTPPSSARGRRPGIAVHRAQLADRDRTMRKGIPVTSPARTLLDFASVVELRELERALDQAIIDRLITPHDLHQVLASYPRRRGCANLRAVLDASTRFESLTRSQLEEELLRLVRAGGLPQPAMNAPVAGFRVDGAWRSGRVAVEVDGYRWHRTRRRMESDRKRELTLRREGWLLLRYSARQVFDEPVLVIADLSTALAERRQRSG